MKLIVKYFLVSFLVLVSAFVNAQETKIFRFTQSEGYYVNLKGEKVYGLIRYVAPYSQYGTNKTGFIEFKEDKKAKKQKIKPEECKEFVREDGFRFIQCLYPLEVKNGLFDQTIESDFLHVVMEGKCSLYYQYLPTIDQGSRTNPNDSRLAYNINMIVKKEGDKRYLRLPVLDKKRDIFLKELFPGDQEIIEVFYQGGPKKILAALDAYNLKHKK